MKGRERREKCGRMGIKMVDEKEMIKVKRRRKRN